MNSLAYQQDCLTRPIGQSLTMGSIFTALSVFQGQRLTPRLAGINIGGLYLYYILQCPMQAIHGRESALHNGAAGGILGYIGVNSGQLGIPFVSYNFFMRYPQLSPALTGAAVYGGMALAISAGGKPI
jgi:hypothetical protein